MNALTRTVTLSLLPAVALLACGGDEGMPEAAAETAVQTADASTDDASDPSVDEQRHNHLTAQEESEGWELLFDGVNLDAWRTYGQPDLHDGWQAVDGLLVRVDGGGDIITRETFTDFELEVDWMVLEGGNSGIFIRASEESGRIFEGAPEMQILDDAVHRDGGDPLTSAGANYALHPAPRGVVRPAGEWNEARMRVVGSHVEQWLNGVLTAEYDLGSPEWSELVAASKFAEWPEYGTYPSGHIGLQDHGDRVSFRNLKVRRIE